MKFSGELHHGRGLLLRFRSPRPTSVLPDRSLAAVQCPRRRPLVRHASPGPRRRHSLVRCTSWAHSSASRPAAADPAWACALGAGQLTPAECPTAGWPFPAFPSLHGSSSQPTHHGCHTYARMRLTGRRREGRRCNYLRVCHQSLNNRSLFVLIPFQFILVALVSCRGDLRSSAISFHITCL